MQNEGNLNLYRFESGLKQNLKHWEVQQWVIDLDNNCFDVKKLSGCFVELTQQGIGMIS